MANAMEDEAVREFILESHENLDKLDREFVEMEKGPLAQERIAGIFRTIHTIKGTAGFLGYTRLESMAHAGESLLAKIRDGELQLTGPMVSELLVLVDRIRAVLKQIEESGQEGVESFDGLRARLLALAAGDNGAAPVPTSRASPAPPAPVPVGEPQFEELPGDSGSAQAVADTSVRVDVALLDKLMNLVGELVLARNQILQFGASLQEPALVGSMQRLNLVTTELQEGVMKTRMQPISVLCNKLPRVVRDVAVACGKQVRVEMFGKETELDRTILEAIRDPLTHVVRNAIDHGIEAPEVRAARKKPKTGTLTLKAFHEGGQVNIEISDDGGGIDPAHIRQKAIQKGLLSAEQAARMSERDLLQLIFVPGFSTAERVSNISGRGVGMDVVKTNIEQIGGTVDIQSHVGQGTTLRLKIPLTLAIIPALMVATRGQRFAIPQVSLLELVRLEGESRKNIEHVHDAQVYRLRGKLLPLLPLGDVLGINDRAEASDDAPAYIVVVQADSRQFGIVVDEVRDTEEIVVKPLGTELKGISAFAGATILGDGGVALILDVSGIAQMTGVVSASRERSVAAKTEVPEAMEQVSKDRQTLLLFRVGDDGRLAVPLSRVSRLEEFAPEAIERAGGRMVVQYRGQILPLIELGQALGQATAVPRSAASPVSVIVYAQDGRNVGLLVDEVLDIVDDNVLLTRNALRPGTLGAAVIQGRVTELLDAPSLIRTQVPNWVQEVEMHA